MKTHTKFIIIVASIIFVIIIGSASYFFYDYNKDLEFTSIDNSFKITLPNKIRPKQTVITKEDYILDIISVKKQIFMYATVFNKERDLNFEELVLNEKETISSSRENVRDASDVKSTIIDGLNTYTYNYTYFDNDYNKDLYTEVYWVIGDSKIYIFDFEVISENADYSKPIFNYAINSLKIIRN